MKKAGEIEYNFPGARITHTENGAYTFIDIYTRKTHITICPEAEGVVVIPREADVMLFTRTDDDYQHLTNGAPGPRWPPPECDATGERGTDA